MYKKNIVIIFLHTYTNNKFLFIFLFLVPDRYIVYTIFHVRVIFLIKNFYFDGRQISL